MNDVRGSLYLLGASAIWGGMCVVGKYTMSSIPPLTLLYMRFLVAFLVLAILIQRKRQKTLLPADHLRVLLLGIIGCTVSIGTQFIGIHKSSATAAAVLTATSPLFITILAPLLLKERLRAKNVVSLIIAAIGMALTTMAPSSNDHNGSMVGNLLLLVAAATWGLYSILGKPLNQKYDPDVVLFWSVLYGIVGLTPFVGIEITVSGLHLPRTNMGWFGVLYLGIFSTVAAFLMWNKGFKLLQSQVAGMFQFVQPVIGTVLAMAWLGEPLSVSTCVGSLVILFGVAVAIAPSSLFSIRQIYLHYRKQRPKTL